MTTHVEERRATFKVVTDDGAFEGNAQASYVSSGFYVNATLDAHVTHGSGLYANAESKGLLIVGGFSAIGDEASYTMTGTLSY